MVKSMDWKNVYQQKLMTPENAVKLIHSGDKVVTSFGCGEPVALERVLFEHREDYNDVEIINMILLCGTLWTSPEAKGHFKYHSFFASASNRHAIAAGDADFTTCHFYEIPEVLRDCVKPRVSMMTVSPPDENGYVSLGTNVDYIDSTLDYCEIKIAQVNKYMPRTAGCSLHSVEDFTCFVEMDEPLPEVPDVPISETEMAIGKNCASLINDGDCIQLGIGGIPNAICEELKHKKNLGLHSEMVGDGVVDLIASGVINNSARNVHKGKSTIGFAFGTRKLFDFINNNPEFEIHPIEYINYPPNIAENDNMVSVNSCLQVDLQGQVVADTIGLTQFSGVGGQVDFVRGATMSRGGRSIIAMPSTAKGGTVSRIVATITENSAITTSRNDVNYVVTEYGIAKLKGKTVRERARALIAIAHPDFRKKLGEEFKKRFGEDL